MKLVSKLRKIWVLWLDPVSKMLLSYSSQIQAPISKLKIYLIFYFLTNFYFICCNEYNGTGTEAWLLSCSPYPITNSESMNLEWFSRFFLKHYYYLSIGSNYQFRNCELNFDQVITQCNKFYCAYFYSIKILITEHMIYPNVSIWYFCVAICSSVKISGTCLVIVLVLGAGCKCFIQ